MTAAATAKGMQDHRKDVLENPVPACHACRSFNGILRRGAR